MLNEFVERSRMLGADAAANGNISTQFQLISPSGYPEGLAVASFIYGFQHERRWPRVVDGDSSAAWNVIEATMANKSRRSHDAKRLAIASGAARGPETRAVASCSYCEGHRYCEPGQDCCCIRCKAFGAPAPGKQARHRKHTF